MMYLEPVSYTHLPDFLEKTMTSNPLKGEYFLPGVVDQLIKENKAKVKVLKSHDKWFGVTSVSYTHLDVYKRQI